MAYTSTPRTTVPKDRQPAPSALTIARLRQFARVYFPLQQAPHLGGVVLN